MPMPIVRKVNKACGRSRSAACAVQVLRKARQFSEDKEIQAALETISLHNKDKHGLAEIHQRRCQEAQGRNIRYRRIIRQRARI